MIEKLKILSKEEVLQELGASEEGSAFRDIFGGMVGPQLPKKEDIMNKINEIIDHINKLEGE